MSEKKVSSLEQAKKKRLGEKEKAARLKLEIKMLPTGTATPVDTIEEYDIFEQAAALKEAHDAEIAAQLCSHFNLHPSESVAFRKTIQGIREEANPTKKKKSRDKKDYAGIDEYYALATSQLGEIKKDIFTEELMYLNKETGIWLPVLNQKDRLTAVADEQNNRLGDEQPAFKTSMVKQYLKRIEGEMKGVVIPEIPKWDGVDRLQIIAKCLVLDGTQPLYTHKIAEDMIKYWCQGVWRKIWDRHYQNPLLIFISKPQGIGKDTLVEALSGGFGQWSCNFSVFSNEKDTQEQLNDSAVLRISEFDRTSRTNIALLKHIITADHTKLRSSYDHASAFRITRCSFISSCNIHDIYRDHTGHRRFLPINLEAIRWEYPREREDKLQILAQGRTLAKEKYALSKESSNAIKTFLTSQTPSDPEDDAIEAWENSVQIWLDKYASEMEKGEILSRGWLTNLEITESGVMKRAANEVGWKEKRLRELLRRRGLDRRIKTAKGYTTPEISENAQPVTLSDDEIPF